MSQKYQQYQPLPTTNGSAMDNPAMIQSSSSDSSNGGSHENVANLSPSGPGHHGNPGHRSGHGTIPVTDSSQQLMPASDSDSIEEEQQRLHGGRTIDLHHDGIGGGGVGGGGGGVASGTPRSLSSVSRYDWFTVTVLCFVNLINYMDRFTIAGVLTDVQTDFSIGNDSAGLLQTAFVISYMVCAPVFGYLGDRYSRRWIMAVGVGLWSTTTLLGSFMQSFGWFMTFRALVGIGEASYSTIAPTIISDLFIHDMRSKMLAMFYFAIPVGSGLGYIVGSKTAVLAQNWRWALRVTPVLGMAAVFLIFLIKDPERGESEGSHNLGPTTYAQDIKDLVKNRSFMLSTAGFTCVAFVTGALAWWGPSFIYSGMKMQPGNENLVLDDISYIFGLVAMTAGVIGVPMGSILSQRLRVRFENCDPYICAGGLLVSAPMVFFALVVPRVSGALCFMFVFTAQVAVNLCWAIVQDMLLYVVVPTRRSTAEAFQILISHALGDAGSPYLVGVISESIMKHLRAHPQNLGLQGELQSLSLVSENLTLSSSSTESILETVTETVTEAMQMIQNNVTAVASTVLSSKQQQESDLIEFQGLQYALFSTSFVEVLGGIFFLFTACFLLKDKYNAARATLGTAIQQDEAHSRNQIA
ncbi:protein spinster isoform X1 [Drosophila tropicalis]|uniref:protein spinster isoform X1 n=1 Tax=Drosophila tropicalis TaxID=46794 RepID=UPI0035ABB283